VNQKMGRNFNIGYKVRKSVDFFRRNGGDFGYEVALNALESGFSSDSRPPPPPQASRLTQQDPASVANAGC